MRINNIILLYYYIKNIIDVLHRGYWTLKKIQDQQKGNLSKKI